MFSSPAIGRTGFEAVEAYYKAIEARRSYEEYLIDKETWDLMAKELGEEGVGAPPKEVLEPVFPPGLSRPAPKIQAYYQAMEEYEEYLIEKETWDLAKELGEELAGAPPKKLLEPAPPPEMSQHGLNDTVYVGSLDNKLYAFKTDSKGLAKSPWPMRGQNARHTGRVMK